MARRMGRAARRDSSSPSGIAVNSAGNLFVADWDNNTVVTGLSPPCIVLDAPAISNGHAQISFSLLSGAGASFNLLNASRPNGPWSTNTAAVLTTNVARRLLRLHRPASASLRAVLSGPAPVTDRNKEFAHTAGSRFCRSRRKEALIAVQNNYRASSRRLLQFRGDLESALPWAAGQLFPGDFDLGAL